jgi:diguanylate cyclase (GGDEF)-like protein/PAS domain S-box-containing protein
MVPISAEPEAGHLVLWDRVPLQLDQGTLDAVGRIARLADPALEVESATIEGAWASILAIGFEDSHVGLQLAAPDGTYLGVNDAFADLLGRRPTEIVGRRWGDLMVSGDREQRTAILRDVAGRGRDGYREMVAYELPDGRVRWGDLNLPVLRFSDDLDPVHLIQVVDATEQIELLTRLREANDVATTSEGRYRALVDPSPDMIIRYAIDGTVVDANGSAVSAIGAPSADEMVGWRLEDCHLGTLAEKLRSQFRLVKSTRQPATLWREWISPGHRPPGWFVVRIVPEVDSDGSVSHVFVVTSDVSELVESEQRLALLALTDPLTDCLNRAAVLDRLGHALERLQRHDGTGLGVVSIDLDHFKAVNDTYGHAAGDLALKAAAEAIKRVTRPGDTIGRMGGDEFVVILEEVDGPDQSDQLAERIRRSIRRTRVANDGAPIALRASVGVHWTAGVLTVTDLLARADWAMYEAKRRGRNRTWSTHMVRQPSRIPGESMRRELQGALARDEFLVHYQPVVDADTLQVVAVEALLRWRRPDGPASPGTFLEVLIESGQIGAVGRWVVATAAEDGAMMLGHDHLADITIHVNLTPAELAQPTIAQAISGAVGQAGLDPARLAIEVTEQAFGGAVVSPSALDEVRSTGVGLILDDFGTGTSSLSHLRTRQLGGIKIDRSFVSSPETGELERRIAGSPDRRIAGSPRASSSSRARSGCR